MNEQDRNNQDEYNHQKKQMLSGEMKQAAVRIDPGTLVTYFHLNKEWDARWPSQLRLPVAGEWLIFTDGDEEETYVIKHVDWFLNSDHEVSVRIQLQ